MDNQLSATALLAIIGPLLGVVIGVVLTAWLNKSHWLRDKQVVAYVQTMEYIDETLKQYRDGNIYNFYDTFEKFTELQLVTTARTSEAVWAFAEYCSSKSPTGDATGRALVLRNECLQSMKRDLGVRNGWLTQVRMYRHERALSRPDKKDVSAS